MIQEVMKHEACFFWRLVKRATWGPRAFNFFFFSFVFFSFSAGEMRHPAFFL